MLILGIETSGHTGGVALVKDGQVISEAVTGVERTHSERLMPALDWTLKSSGWQYDDLCGISVSVGPGSYTGLRIGVVTAKALGFGLGIPVVGVGTLKSLAYNTAGTGGVSVSLIDARRSRVYWSAWVFEDGDDDGLCLVEDSLETIDLVCQRLAEIEGERPGEKYCFLGSGAERYRAPLIESLKSGALAQPGLVQPRAASVALLGSRRLSKGDSDDVDSLEPRYMRLSEAELRQGRDSCPGCR